MLVGLASDLGSDLSCPGNVRAAGFQASGASASKSEIFLFIRELTGAG